LPGTGHWHSSGQAQCKSGTRPEPVRSCRRGRLYLVLGPLRSPQAPEHERDRRSGEGARAPLTDGPQAGWDRRRWVASFSHGGECQREREGGEAAPPQAPLPPTPQPSGPRARGEGVLGAGEGAESMNPRLVECFEGLLRAGRLCLRSGSGQLQGSILRRPFPRRPGAVQGRLVRRRSCRQWLLASQGPRTRASIQRA